MNSSHSQFTGSIPEIYDTCLGPLLFEFSAKDLAERVGEAIPPKGDIFEVACGTGILTYHLRKTLPDTVRIVATDLNEAMLEHARKKRSNFLGVTFEKADALSLPFEDGGFDAVVCQFGIMFFPDKLKGLMEMMRVLKPGGFLAFNVWDSLQQNPCAAIAHETIARFVEGDPPQFLKTPFGFHDIEHIKTLLAQAGLENTEYHVVSEVIEGLEAAQIAKGLVEGNPGIIEINERATVEASEVTKAVSKAIEDAFAPQPLKIPLQEIVFKASKPD
jgi:ubiquinone/menaquinone biosynthesis C-methylase UbiE